MKKPIPDEHLVLKTTFEGLIQKCLAVATDPVSPSDGDDNSVHLYLTKRISGAVIVVYLIFSQQTKRKLDDANKRLEALYDKLREQMVSVPQGLVYCTVKIIRKEKRRNRGGRR